MGGEKTEKATPKKRQDARKEGQVLKSTELTTAFCTIIMIALLMILWQWYTEKLLEIYSKYLGSRLILTFSEGFNASAFSALLTNALLDMADVLLPILGAAMVAGVAVNIVQTGPMFTTKPVKPKLNKINPITGFKRLFSMRSLVELIKSLAKIAVLGYIAYGDYRRLLASFPELIGQDVKTAFLGFMNWTFTTMLKMAAVMAIIGAADFLYQWWKYEKDLRMTKQEVKDEYKQTEGDPQIKGKIRSKQRQMSAMRMMARVPEADVVITNPTHYAIALKYDDKSSSAPVVIAKGADYLARKIKEVAAEYNIEIVENKPLAQSLYAMCELDDEIPQELYQAVADILVFVYRQKHGRR